MPILLILYDAQSDKAYWLHVQTCFSAQRRTFSLARQDTVTVYVPRKQRLTKAAVKGFGRLRDSVLARIQRIIFDESRD